MSTKYHLCVDIKGYLMNHTKKRDYEKMFMHDDGRFMSADEAKQALLDELAAGKKVLPADACDNFDYQKGCGGHRVDDAS